MKIAVVQENKIVLILDDPTEEVMLYHARNSQAAIDITDSNPMPQVNWVFDGINFSSLDGATPTRKITKLGLRRRLTFTELCTLETAAQSVIQVKALMGNLQVSTYVDLNRADTIAGMGLLVSLGLITPERADVILTAPIQEDEKYRGNE